MACPDASAAIHECVVAIKARVTIDVLADTIHAFPSTSRIFNGLFADALRELEKAPAGRLGLVARRRRRPGRAAVGPSRARRPVRPAPSGRRSAGRPGPRAGRARAGRDRAPGRHRRADAGRPDRPLERERLVRPERRRAGRPTRVGAGDGHRQARPRVDRLDRRVRPEREHRAGVGERPPRVAVRLGPVAPQPARGRGVGPEVDRLDRGRDPGPREPRRGRPDGAAGRARAAA